MKKIRTLIITITCLLSVIPAFSQEFTEYEQKRYDLAVSGLEKVMNTMNAYDQAVLSVNLMEKLKKAEGDKFQEMAITENVLFKLFDFGDMFETEANILANSIYPGDVYNGMAVQEWKKIGDWYKQERTKLEKTKTPEDIKREQERAELLRDTPDISGVKKRVKKDYLKWAKKDQFEKTAAYEERLLKQGAHIFDSLCFVHVNNVINENINKTPAEEYDADREGVDIVFYYEDSKGQKQSSVQGFWPVTPDQYKNLRGKTIWESTYAIGVFVINEDIYPAVYHWEFSRRNNDRYYFDCWDIQLGEAQACPFVMNDVLVGSVNNIPDHVFDYTEYSQKLITLNSLQDSIFSIEKEYRTRYHLKPDDSPRPLLLEDKDNKYMYNFGFSETVYGVKDGNNYDKPRFYTPDQVMIIMNRVKAYYYSFEANKIVEKYGGDASVVSQLLLNNNKRGVGRYITNRLKEEIGVESDKLDEKALKDFVKGGYTYKNIFENITQIIDKSNSLPLEYHVDQNELYARAVSGFDYSPYYQRKYGEMTPKDAWNTIIEGRIFRYW